MIFIKYGKTHFLWHVRKAVLKWRRIECVYWQSWWYRRGTTTYEATFSQTERRSHTLQFIPQVFKRLLLWRPVCVSGKIIECTLLNCTLLVKTCLHNFSMVEYLSITDFVTSTIFTNTFLINSKFCRLICNLEKISMDLFSRKAKKIREITKFVPRKN